MSVRHPPGTFGTFATGGFCRSPRTDGLERVPSLRVYPLAKSRLLRVRARLVKQLLLY